jgi:DNA-binding NarL/FixJ family response regulator
MKPAHVTVVLAGDHEPTRLGIRLALERVGYAVVAEAASADAAVDATLASRASICVLDLAAADDRISACRRIRDGAPETKTVVLINDPTGADMFEAVVSGASGYLAKTISSDRLGAALGAVLEGEATLPRSLEARLIEEFRSRELGEPRGSRFRPTRPGDGLTARESQVLGLIAERLPTVVIAQRLGISEVTVRRHVSSAIHKLGVADRSSAVELLQREHRIGGGERDR